MNRIIRILSITLLIPSLGHASGETMDLRGAWPFQLDEQKSGLREHWFEKDLKDQIPLPGSTDEAGFGVKSAPDPVRLTREHRYVGPAWYQKTVEIPQSWQGKRVVLFLERAMWETRLWLDGDFIGMQDSLCTSHRFDLTEYLTPGRHRLTLRIDNRLKINVGHEGGWSRMWAMSLTEESQGNWNGVIGRIELQATDPVWIERVEAHPDLDHKQTRVTAWVRSQVSVIDDFNECHRLAVVIEAKVGKGRLLVNSLNLGKEGQRTPAQKQMLKSLLARAGDRSAVPAASLNAEQIDTIFRPIRSMNLKSIGGSIAEVSSFNPGMEKEKMCDGAAETFWHSRYDGGFAPPPHYVVLELPAGTAVAGLSYVAWSGGNGNGHVKGYAVSVSDDGKTWESQLASGALKTGLPHNQEIRFPAPTQQRFIKFEITDAVSLGGQPIAAIGELDVLLK